MSKSNGFHTFVLLGLSLYYRLAKQLPELQRPHILKTTQSPLSQHLAFGCLLLMMLWAQPGKTGAPAFDVLHNFGERPGQAYGSPVQDAGGNLYGYTLDSTITGGISGHGTIYKLSRDGEYSVLHEFDATADLREARLSLILGPNGALYGVTPRGGAAELGTVFRIDTDGRNFRIVHEFTAAEGAPITSGIPATAILTLGSDGNFYGTSAPGTAADGGSVFRMDPSGNYSVVHAFSLSDGAGANPVGGVTQGPDGSLYGVTATGGADNLGTVYKVTLSGDHTILYEFKLSSIGQNYKPSSSLGLGTDGTLYGTVRHSAGSSILYKIESGGVYTKIKELTGITESYAMSPVLGGDGKMYGTVATYLGSGDGYVYRLDAAGNFEVIAESIGFPAEDNFSGPAFSLIPGTDGHLYGATTTIFGNGRQARSALYRVAYSGEVNILHRFVNNVPRRPDSRLTVGADGNLYGTTQAGGKGRGVVFKRSTDGTLAILHVLSRELSINPIVIREHDGDLYWTETFTSREDGINYSKAELYRLSRDGDLSVLLSLKEADSNLNLSQALLTDDGVLYLWTKGTRTAGKAGLAGGVYRIEPGGQPELLHNFGDADPNARINGLTLGPKGDIYGTVLYGAIAGEPNGFLFKLDSNGVPQVLHTFDTVTGTVPNEPLVVDSRGNLYGTTAPGGDNNQSVLYQLDVEGNYRVLHHFADMGNQRAGFLLLDRTDTLYGSITGGQIGDSIVFKLTPGEGYTVLHKFPVNDGTLSDLVLGADGKFYGSTKYGGLGDGYLYQLSSGGDFSMLQNLSTATGVTVIQGLTLGSDAALYGVAETGGKYDWGTIFRLQSDASSGIGLSTGPDNPVAPGETVTLRATVTGKAPSGSVSFFDGEELLGIAQLSEGVATFTVSNLTPGTHPLSASYSGDTNNPAATSTTTALVVASGSRTAPLVSYNIEGPQGANGWYTNYFGLTWTVTEQQSWPVTASDGCRSLFSTEETARSTYTCSATSAGGTTTVSVTVKLDKFAPVITCPTDVSVIQGQPVQIGKPTVTDTVDLAPQISNDAPTSYLPGTTTVTWSAIDAAGHLASCTQAVTVPVVEHNKQPRAKNDVFMLHLHKMAPVSITAPGVLANDRDPEGAKLTVAGASPFSPRIIKMGHGCGTVTLRSNGSLEFTPGSGSFCGVRSFTYQASDGSTLSAPAKVILLVKR